MFTLILLVLLFAVFLKVGMWLLVLPFSMIGRMLHPFGMGRRSSMGPRWW